MKKVSKRIFRYFALAFAILVFIWMAALVAVYFFVDVNELKSVAVKYVNEKTKGELSVGAVELKLFPMVHFRISDVAFKSSPAFKKEDLFKCSNVKLSFGLWSLLFGNPDIRLDLDKPYLKFVSIDDKNNNISDLIPAKEVNSEVLPQNTEKSETISDKDDPLYYVFMSKFTFNVRDAELIYNSPKANYDVKSLSFLTQVDPANRSITLKAGSPLSIKDETFKITGNWDLEAVVKPSGDENYDVYFMLDATKLDYESKAFIKTKGTPLKLEFSAKGNQNNIVIEKAELVLVKPFLNVSGKVSGLNAEQTPLDLNIEVKPIELSDLKKMLVSLKDYNVSGSFLTTLAVSGTLQNLSLELDLDGTKAGMSSEHFKKAEDVSLVLNTSIVKSKDSVKVKSFKLKLIDDILELKATLSKLDSKDPHINMSVDYLKLDFTKFSKVLPSIQKTGLSGYLTANAELNGSLEGIPHFKATAKYKDDKTKNNLTLGISNSSVNTKSFTANISSSYLDLDPFMPEESKTTVKTDSKNKSQKGEKKSVDKNEVVIEKDLVKELNELLNEYSLKLNASVTKAKAQKIFINDITLNAVAGSGKINLSKLSLKTLGGTFDGSMLIDANVAKPSFKTDLEIKSLKVKEALESMMPDLKGVIDGVLSAKLNLSGSGYKVGDLQKSLLGSGDFSFNDFVYSSAELNQTINSKLGDTLGKFTPSKKLTLFSGNPGWETVHGKFNIKNERINLEKIIAKEKDYLAEGKGWVDFNNYMDMDFMVTVPYRNIPYEALRVKAKDLSTLPLYLSGPVAKPKVDLVKMAEYVAKKAIEYETEKLKQQAKKEADKIKAQAKSKLDSEAKKAEGKLKDAIKGFKF